MKIQKKKIIGKMGFFGKLMGGSSSKKDPSNKDQDKPVEQKKVYTNPHVDAKTGKKRSEEIDAKSWLVRTHEMFVSLDLDGSGQLSKQELMKGFADLGLEGIDSDTVDKMIKE